MFCESDALAGVGEPDELCRLKGGAVAGVLCGGGRFVDAGGGGPLETGGL